MVTSAKTCIQQVGNASAHHEFCVKAENVSYWEGRRGGEGRGKEGEKGGEREREGEGRGKEGGEGRGGRKGEYGVEKGRGYHKSMFLYQRSG